MEGRTPALRAGWYARAATLSLPRVPALYLRLLWRRRKPLPLQRAVTLMQLRLRLRALLALALYARLNTDACALLLSPASRHDGFRCGYYVCVTHSCGPRCRTADLTLLAATQLPATFSPTTVATTYRTRHAATCRAAHCTVRMRAARIPFGVLSPACGLLLRGRRIPHCSARVLRLVSSSVGVLASGKAPARAARTCTTLQRVGKH